MPLARELLDVLVCPSSKQPLLYFEADALLVCPASRLAYRIDHGVPVLLAEEAREISPEELAGFLAKAKDLGLPGA